MAQTAAAAPRKQLDAIELLMQDHREVESLFREVEYLQTKDQDAGHVIEVACAELKANGALQSELFCPAVLDAVGEADIEGLLAAVEEGQQAIRDLITRVERADADHAERDAQFSLLSERVERQFELAETQVFPRARRMEGLDLLSVADQMKARKNEMAREL
jgi:hypothetical protein